MTFGPQLSLCPSCNSFSLRVIESRRSQVARRRRSHCEKCNHRVTTHEVTDEFFQQAKENAIIVEKLKGLLGAQAKFQLNSRCHDCSYNQSDSCSFGFPEFGMPDSADCNHYTP